VAAADRRLAVVALALGVALAVPPARSAIFDWLGIGSARIELVDRLPALEPAAPLSRLGGLTTLAGAYAEARFPFAPSPHDEGAPDEVRVVPGQRVSYAWRDGDRVRLLITQVPARLGEEALLRKLVPPGVTIEQLAVEGRRAVWIAGGPHAVFLVEPEGRVRKDQRLARGRDASRRPRHVDPADRGRSLA
jgi:hypothetical protein